MSQQNPQKPTRTQHTTLGYKIHHFEEVPSTNDVAKEIARTSSEERIVVLAETQTKGKGRMGRQWFSPKGGVWLSIILRPRISPKEALKLTFITSLAVAKTIQKTFGLKTEVKWPNDVLVNGRKVCGILTEASTRGNIVDYAVVGVGINANIDLASLPSNLQDTATSLKHELSHEVRRKALIKNLLQNLEHNYKRLQRGMWNAMLQEWKSHATFLGEQVEVASFGEVFVGEALDVDEDGALIVRLEDGVLKRVVAGDVTVRKKL